MRGRNDDLVRAQTEILETLKERASVLAREYENDLEDDTRRSLRQLCEWISLRADKNQSRENQGKISVTRIRLLSLQLEKVLEQLSSRRPGTAQSELCRKLDQLLVGQQRRELYDDMISCLKELATLCVEKGMGKQAVLYNEMGQRLETRLETGHIDINNDEQRAKDKALYAEFQQKLESMKA